VAVGPNQVIENVRHSGEDRGDHPRIVELSLLKASRRHGVFDPKIETTRFPYWS
jgi:hypothetical protein